ncbi:hypothetical protein CLIB1423_14S02960 [[Candida] railenensis]|uniref:Putative transcription factor kapC n=1 Tax=[Candida] railenensis TaxID=45579 RepID=A0A9P0QT72_9ASCO|nr:hypothetical protein CLIB1423_14S02960 [[Candida] railenensis]
MNTGYSTWNDKEIKDAGQIDPSFDRHQDAVFPSVVDVTAAAVANVQQQDSQSQAQQSQQGQQGQQGQQIQQGQQDHQQQQQQEQRANSLTHHLQHSDSPPLHDDLNDHGDKLKRRPVSNTKRAAQNRSAQKAFRLRKEKYIKELEDQAIEVQQLKQTIEELRAENLQLRDYTLALQSRVIELSPSHPPQQGQPDHVPAPPAAVFNSGNAKMFSQDK